MGQFEFQVAQPNRLPEFTSETAHVIGIDRVPSPGATQWVGETLFHRRASSESGAFVVPWTVSPGQWMTANTAFLRESAGPFLLERELARGMLHQARQTAFLLQHHGVAFDADLSTRIDDTTRQFVRHLARRVAEDAVDVIESAFGLQERLAETLARHTDLLAYRTSSRDTLWRAGMVYQPFETTAEEDEFLQLFDTVAVDVRWREIEPQAGRFDWTSIDRWVEWGGRHERRVLLSNLVKLDAIHLPPWVCELSHRPERVYHHVAAFLIAAVERYGGRVAAWECAAGFNLPGILGWNMEERLKLTMVALDTVRRQVPQRPLLVGFAQPWSESLVQRTAEISSFHFADMLLRADLGVGGISIELAWAYWPNGSLVRTGLQLHTMLRQWSLFHLPMFVRWSIPHHPCGAPVADGTGKILFPAAGCPADGGWQAAELARTLPLCLAHHAVHGAVWASWRDDDAPQTPHTGMWDAADDDSAAVRDAWRTAFAMAEERSKSADR